VKFNKKDYKHYIIFVSYLLIFITGYFVTKVKKNNNNTVFLMGHSFEGNLESFYNLNKGDYAIKYLTFDKNKVSDNKNFFYYINLKNVIELLNCKFIIASHGILFHKLLKKRKITTISIGHGVQTAIEDLSKSYHLLFDEVWLSSELDKEIMIDECNYPGSNIQVTGYLSHQLLYTNFKNQNKNKEKYILYAPSALSGAKENMRNPLFVHNLTFLKKLNLIAQNYQYKIIVKPHIKDVETKNFNQETYNFIKEAKNLIYYDDLSIEKNNLSNIAEILITDWSSIYLDFLLQDKETIFLNSPKIDNNYNLSSFMKNEFINRCESWKNIDNHLKKIIEDPNGTDLIKFKKFVFRDLNFLEINSNCKTRLEHI